MPDDPAIREGILKGMYRFKAAENPTAPLKAQLMGSGAIMNEVLEAQHLLADRFNVAADVWSVTSYKALRRDGLEVDRWNMLHPDETPAARGHLSRCVADAPGVFVAASDYTKTLPDSVARWFSQTPHRPRHRRFRPAVTAARRCGIFSRLTRPALPTLPCTPWRSRGNYPLRPVQKARADLHIDAEKTNPMLA